MSYKIFISHGSGDKFVANHIREKLTENGIESFLDHLDVDIGNNFREKILGELSACDELLCLLTPTSLAKAWVAAEIGAAAIQGKTIVPVKCYIEDEVLQKRGFFSLFGDVAPRSIDELMNDFNSYIEAIQNRIEEKKNA